MKKIYAKLTEDQLSRGVLFSSELVPGGIVHEVFIEDLDGAETIKKLLNDKFFNGSPYKYNLIRK